MKLPLNFKTWMEFYDFINNNIPDNLDDLHDSQIIQHSLFDSDHFDKKEFKCTVGELRSNICQEILKLRPDISSVRSVAFVLGQAGSVDQGKQNQIIRLLEYLQS